MRPELWKVYDKKGSNLNLHADSYLNLIFSTDVGKDAAGYAITDIYPDSSSKINRTFITNGGWNYDSFTQVYLDYVFDSFGAFQVDASITFKDVSIFNPEFQNSKSIASVYIDDSTNYIYPAVTYAGAIFLEPVSQGLIETEHLTFLQEASVGFVSPYDASNSTLTFRMVGDEEEIKFFTIDENSQEVIWAEELIFDVSQYVINQGLQINIGFKSDDEGVYERRMVVYHTVNQTDFPLMEIVLNAQSIGQDERYDTLLENFGLYKPKSIPALFKEADLNEALPDWKLLNYKAKHMILEHHLIMPYIGTYKGLINAIKWLGYEDIQVKEWFKDVKENKKISLYVPYDAEERKKTIKYFTPEERKNLKKLNQLSLVYCITRETGEVDDWGNPITENCYEYNLNEILIKLFSLKTWLEKNIIGVNARISDLTGEGVYFERFQNFIYGTQNLGTVAIYEQSLTPQTINTDSELVTGDASILLTLKEYGTTTFENLTCNIIDLARYGWDPSNGYFSPEDYLNLSTVDPSAVFFGSPVIAPFADLYDLQWKLSVEKEFGVVTDSFVTNPLFIHKNEIRFYNTFDVSSLFLDISANVDVTLEKAYFRDPSIDEWTNSIAYSIYQQKDPSTGNNTGKWVLESSMGNKSYTWGELSLQTSVNPQLMYAYDQNYNVPLLSINGYKWTDASGISHDLDKTYYLDILDGKIAMDTSMLAVNGDEIQVNNYINFNYDTSMSEQKITLNVTYTSPRMPVFSFDPSDVSLLYYNPDASVDLVEDNSIYRFDVNHAGHYEIEIFGWNGQNNLFFNFDRDGYPVWQKYPTINSYIDTSCAGNIEYLCTSIYITPSEVSAFINSSINPIFDRMIPLQGLKLKYDVDNKPYINVPSITYFQDAPESGSISRFYNLTEKITNISGLNITIDPDYQSFYAGDNVKIVQFDKGKFSFLQETSSNIVSGVSPSFTLDAVPSNFTMDASHDWYLLNETQRPITQITNDFDNKIFSCYIYYPFQVDQVVAVIIDDLSTGYSWGSSFKVIDLSTYDPFNGYYHTFQGNIPELILDDPSQYYLTAKHAFSTFSDFQINVNHTTELDNNFHVYLDDTYFHQYYLDDTFVVLNIDFNQERVLQQWYDPSDNMINTEFYPFSHSIKLDVSTLVIFKADYDVSNYMLNQQNIWEIRERMGEKIMRVNNFVVPFIFNESGKEYDISVESYDSYGNLKKKMFDGLIKIV